jgi:BNR repeat-like domain
MNHKSDELNKGTAQSLKCRTAPKKSGRALAVIALACLAALSAVADNHLKLSPPVELSRPNVVAGCDDGISLPGPWTLDDAAEPYVAVNPVDPKNIVAAWIQGPFQNIISASSFDGGKTWQQVPVPLTVCSGGLFLGTGDPWLSFSPNGDLYAIAAAGESFDNPSVAVNKSTDGGLNWSAATIIYTPPDDITAGDKPSITADPKNSKFVYAVWEVYASSDGAGDHTVFARTSNGGKSWEPARTIFLPPLDNDDTDPQIAVLPDGTLVCLISESSFNQTTGDPEFSLTVIRSSDRGQTWSSRISLAQQFWQPVTDFENGQTVRSYLHSLAVDPHNGNLYVVWEDSRFSHDRYNSIVFSMSADGGVTWTTPIPINQTPRRGQPGNRQAFLPDIAVAADGTIGVTYYDFRFNDGRPGLPTDYWLVQCHPSRKFPATNPASWGDEVRLTPKSFDMEQAWSPTFEYFVGDYEGLTAIGNDFVTAFNQVDRDNVTSIFFRRVAR